ncbi:MAG: hypothetical protein ACR2GH_12355 [Pseudonocardia sp.]
MITDEEMGDRTRRAVAAAAAADRDLGLTVSEPRVLYDVFSVVVHLAPAPVVVRVPTVLPRTVAADPDAQAAQQRVELTVAGWLADRGHPVVPPSPLVPREPVARDGFSMTMWQLVEQVQDADLDAGRCSEVTAHLHAALRGYPGELPFLMPLDESILDGLAQLEHSPDLLSAADLERARREWATIEPIAAPGPPSRRRSPGPASNRSTATRHSTTSSSRPTVSCAPTSSTSPSAPRSGTSRSSARKARRPTT